MVSNWVDAPRVAASDRINLRAIQGMRALIVLLFFLSEVRGVAEGYDRLANVFVASATIISFLLVRAGRFRPSVILLLPSFTAAMAFALVTTGLSAQSTALKFLVIPQLLAGHSANYFRNIRRTERCWSSRENANSMFICLKSIGDHHETHP